MKRPTALLLVFAILFSMFMGISLNRTAAVAEMDSNLARGKTVTSSSSLEASGWGTAKATDGVRGMGQNSNGWTSYYFPWMNHREWVAVDLGSVTTIGRVDLYSREINPGVGASYFNPLKLDL
ncbi:MAG: hypothetical protein K0Q73_6328 [Paenibacillus sp.]|nr:hypothetical protein [Paenibacillus sp.]